MTIEIDTTPATITIKLFSRTGRFSQGNYHYDGSFSATPKQADQIAGGEAWILELFAKAMGTRKDTLFQIDDHSIVNYIRVS